MWGVSTQTTCCFPRHEARTRAGQRRECKGTHSCPFAPLSCCAVAEEAPATDGEWFAPALATTSEPRREAVATTLAHASELPSRCWARLMDAGTRRSGMTAAAAWTCAAGEAARRTCARAKPSVFTSGAMPEDIAFDLERSPLRRRRARPGRRLLEVIVPLRRGAVLCSPRRVSRALQ